jgi:hypothetical protein
MNSSHTNHQKIKQECSLTLFFFIYALTFFPKLRKTYSLFKLPTSLFMNQIFSYLLKMWNIGNWSWKSSPIFYHVWCSERLSLRWDEIIKSFRRLGNDHLLLRTKTIYQPYLGFQWVSICTEVSFNLDDLILKYCACWSLNHSNRFF